MYSACEVPLGFHDTNVTSCGALTQTRCCVTRHKSARNGYHTSYKNVFDKVRDVLRCISTHAGRVTGHLGNSHACTCDEPTVPALLQDDRRLHLSCVTVILDRSDWCCKFNCAYPISSVVCRSACLCTASQNISCERVQVYRWVIAAAMT